MANHIVEGTLVESLQNYNMFNNDRTTLFFFFYKYDLNVHIFWKNKNLYWILKKKLYLERAFLKSDKLFKTWISTNTLISICFFFFQKTNIKVLLAVWEMLSFQLIMILGGDLGHCHLLKIHYVNKKQKKKKSERN